LGRAEEMPEYEHSYYKHWLCTACGRDPHVLRGTRRGFKWAGLIILLIFSVGLRARAAVVVAEGDAFLPEAVKIVENQHARPRREALRLYTRNGHRIAAWNPYGMSAHLRIVGYGNRG
jgi:hypothetical protein